MSALDPRICLPAALFAIALAAPAVAQQEEPQGQGPYPRPHIVTEGDVVVRPNDLAIKYYVSESSQSGATAKATGEEAQYYVFYEPPIFLHTVPAEDGAGRKLDTHVSDDGTVTLSFRWDTDVDETRDAIRGAISGTAYADAEISPFFVEDSWFESALDPELRSEGFPRQAFTSSGTMHAYFQIGSRDAADKFAAGLNGLDDTGPPIQINFRYTFSGVARDNCTVTVSGEQIRETSQFKDLEGDGSEKRVTREQAAEIMDDISRAVNIQATCRDVGAADRLVKTAMERLGSPDEVIAGNWEEFGRFTRLNPQDFAANVSRSLEESNKTVDRTQWRQADVEVDDIAVSIKAAASVIWGLVNTAMSAGFERASQEARSRFLDILEKNSLSLAWTGEKFQPKSVDVYTTGRLVNTWKDGVSLRYTHIADRTGAAYNVPLTEENWLGVISVTPDEALELRDELDRRTRELDRRTQELDARARAFSRTMDARERALSAVSERLNAVASGLETQVASIDRRFSSIMGSIMTHTYLFDLVETRKSSRKGDADYVTGVNADEYMASIASWNLSCTAEGSLAPYLSELSTTGTAGEGHWMIAFTHTTTPCNTLRVMVNYFKEPVHGYPNWRHLRKVRTKGPALILSGGTEFED